MRRTVQSRLCEHRRDPLKCRDCEAEVRNATFRTLRAPNRSHCQQAPEAIRGMLPNSPGESLSALYDGGYHVEAV